MQRAPLPLRHAVSDGSNAPAAYNPGQSFPVNHAPVSLEITMPLATPALDALRDTLPEEFKDTRLNMQSVLAGENLTDAQAFGVALAAAHFLRAPRLAAALTADLQAGLGDAAAPVISDAVAAAGLMAMNTVYYRFRHMIGKESYAARPPRLRMQRMAKPATTAVDFELMSLACAALAGCEFCLQNHEAKLLAEGTGEEACHDAVRIAAVVSAAACGLE
jgi:alkyl hydroperoxide reductase subunit D